VIEPITGFPAIGVTLIVVLVIALVLTGVSLFLGPKKPTAPKLMPYESGMTPVGGARRQFGIHYYVVAMLFIIFDIEAIFLYPWATLMMPAIRPDPSSTQEPLNAVFLLAEMAVFMTILFVGYIYMYKKGALEWE